MFSSSKRKDITRITNKAPPTPRDFRAEFNQVISQIHAKRTASHDEFGGRLNRLEGPRDMEVVCVKNSLKKNDTPAGMGFHFGSILGYSTEQVMQGQDGSRHHRVEIGEGRSDFAEMKRKLELNLHQSCRFKQHANISSALKDTCASSEMIMSGSDDHDDSDSARGRSASSSGSCHSANESISGSGSEVDEADSPQDPDELMLDKFANECKISLSTAPMKPTVIHIDTPLKENLRDEEFIEAKNEILAVDKHPDGNASDNVYEDVVAVESGATSGSVDSSIDSSAVSAWLAKRGVVLEDCDAPRIVSVSRVEEKDDQIKVVKRRFLKHDPKRRRADNVTSVSTDSQYSSDESTDAVKSSEASVCSEFSESRDTVILGDVDTANAAVEIEVKGERQYASCNYISVQQENKAAPRNPEDQRISASSEKEERSETVDLSKCDFDVLSQSSSSNNAPKASSVVVVSRPKKSFKAIRAQYDRHMAVEDDLIEVLPSVRRLAHMFRHEGDPSDLKNKYHSLTGRSLSKEFRQKQMRPKPSLPRSARFDEAPPMERPRTQLHQISELSEIQEVPSTSPHHHQHQHHSVPPTPPQQPEAAVKRTAKSQKIQAVRSGSATVSGAGESKKKKSRSKAASCKGFFDREILARLSKFQQFI